MEKELEAGRLTPQEIPDDDFDFTLPDGFDPGDYLDEFKTLARELKLGREEAEKLVAFWAEVSGDIENAREEAWKEAGREWAHATARDPEVGGRNLEGAVRVAARVVNAFGSEGLKEVFRATGLGNHPEVVRFLMKVGRAMSEDTLLGASQAGRSRGASAAELIYGRP